MLTTERFTVAQIKAAHAQVKTGADFPTYIRDLIQLGVTGYESYVGDGHIVYFGTAGYQTQAGPKYPALLIAKKSNQAQFQQDLKDHQHGKTDYPTFCRDAAQAGVEKWVVDTEKMTCTYYDKAGQALLVEAIPLP